MTTIQPVDRGQQVLEMHVSKAGGPITISRAVEGALDEQHLRGERVGLIFQDAGPAVRAVGQQVGLDLFGQLFTRAAAAGDLFTREASVRWQKAVAPPQEDCKIWRDKTLNF